MPEKKNGAASTQEGETFHVQRLRDLGWAILLGMLVVVGTHLWGTLLPYSKFRDAIYDLVTLPPLLIAGWFYPQGIHTGTGAAGWAVVANVAMFGFYTILSYVILRVVRRVSAHRGSK
jgi:hypothetical protein